MTAAHVIALSAVLIAMLAAAWPEVERRGVTLVGVAVGWELARELEPD